MTDAQRRVLNLAVGLDDAFDNEIDDYMGRCLAFAERHGLLVEMQ